MTDNTPYHKEGLMAIAGGDQQAFRRLYNDFKHRIYSVAFNYLRDEDEATEVTQRVFVRFWEKRSNFADVESIEEYVLATARYAVYDHLRYLYRQARLIAGSRSRDQVDFVDAGDYKRLNNIWQGIILKLPPQQRKVYEMVELRGLTLDLASKEMEIHKETVKAHLKAARKFVRQEMLKAMRTGGFADDYAFSFLFLLFFLK